MTRYATTRSRAFAHFPCVIFELFDGVDGVNAIPTEVERGVFIGGLGRRVGGGVGGVAVCLAIAFAAAVFQGKISGRK